MLTTTLRPKATGEFLLPGGLIATAISSSEIDLQWSAVATATGYHVERDGQIIAVAFPGTSFWTRA